MIKELTCIVCPVGCQLKIELEDEGEISVNGNTCPRGINYAKAEMTNPTRVITTTVRAKTGELIPVKTNGAVKKSKIFECMKIINSLHPDISECDMGTVLCENILESGANVVVAAPTNRRR